MSLRHSDDAVAPLHRLAFRATADLPDQQLLQQFLADRNEHAFAVLVERHGPMVLAVCRRVLHQPQDADDAWQAVFVILARKAASIRKPTALVSWLHGVALRVARHLKADIQRRQSPLQPLTQEPAVPVSTEPTLRAALALLDEELQRLPEKYRAPLVLCYLEGKSRDEAAEQLGQTVGSVHGRLERGRNMLRSRLARRGLAPSAGALALVLTESTGTAAVPLSLTQALLSAVLDTTNQSAKAMIAPRVIVLAEGVMKAMSTVRLQMISLALLMTTLLGTGATVLAYQAQEKAPPTEKPRTSEVKSKPAEKDDNGGRPDLLPVEARWRTLAADVRGVKVDASGKPWFEIETTEEVKDLRAHIERNSVLSVPWIKDVKILKIDRKGRVWVRPRYQPELLLGYDPAKKQWIERKLGQEDGQHVFLEAVHEGKSGRLYFSDRRGVHVLDGTQWSYQPIYRLNIEKKLYHDTIQGFDEPQFAEYDDRVFVWTSWGRYGWTGTVGFFVHDGKKWTHRLIHDAEATKGKDSLADPDLNRLTSVYPLTNNRVVVCPQSAFAAVLTLHEPLDAQSVQQVEKDIAALGDNAFRVREKASQRLEKRGAQILPLLRSGLTKYQDKEILGRLRRLIDLAEKEVREPLVDGHRLRYTRINKGHDNAHAWIWFDASKQPGKDQEDRNGYRQLTREGKLLKMPAEVNDWYVDSMFTDRKGRVYLARYRKGSVRFENEKGTPITDETQTSLRHILGEDRGGRIYFSDERRLHVHHPDAEEVRLSLPTTIYETPLGEHDVEFDSQGRLWACLAEKGRDDAGTMSVFEKGAFRTVPLPGRDMRRDKLMIFFPLKEGKMIVQDVSRRPLLYDGDGWQEFESLKDLIEKKHKLLSEAIDNRRWGRDFYAKMRVDADKRIWLVNWEQSDVWDGQRWHDVTKSMKEATRDKAGKLAFLLPHPDRKSMLAISDLNYACYRLSFEQGKLKVERQTLPINTRIGSDYTTRSGMWIDHADRVWLPRDADSCVRIDQKETKLIPDTGYPRYVDSRKCIWFSNPYKRKIVVLDPEGRRAELTDDVLSNETLSIAEDKDGSLWLTTERGLLQVSVTTSGFGIKKGKLYEKDVPRGSCLRFGIDRERNLWFYGPGPEHRYRVYRVQLPASQ